MRCHLKRRSCTPYYEVSGISGRPTGPTQVIRCRKDLCARPLQLGDLPAMPRKSVCGHPICARLLLTPPWDPTAPHRTLRARAWPRRYRTRPHRRRPSSSSCPGYVWTRALWRRRSTCEIGTGPVPKVAHPWSSGGRADATGEAKIGRMPAGQRPRVRTAMHSHVWLGTPETGRPENHLRVRRGRSKPH